MKEIAKKIDEEYYRDKPRYLIMGIDWGFAYQEPKRIPLTIGGKWEDE